MLVFHLGYDKNITQTLPQKICIITAHSALAHQPCAFEGLCSATWFYSAKIQIWDC